MSREVRVELLMGREVHDSDGRRVGHLEEIRSRHVEGEHRVTHYLVGAAALLERLAVHAASVLGFSREPRGYVVRWDQMDLSDPEHPRTTCPIEDLRPMKRPGRTRRRR